MKLEMQVKLFLGEKKAGIAFKAIQPEIGQEFSRSRTAINIKKGMLLIDIKAADAKALRASLNSVLKLMITANDLLEKA